MRGPTMRHLTFGVLAAFAAASAVGAARPVHVFIAGDSTASEYPADQYPQLGWGMVLKCAFGDDVVVRDYAVSGRSSKSFVTQGYFSQLEREIRAGDTLLIQFGHNDEKIEDPTRYTDAQTDYKIWLTRYIDLARSRDATPVLLTPVARRKFENGVLVDTHGAYAQAVRDLASRTHTPLIDLAADSMRWISSLGDQASKRYFLIYTPEDHNERFPGFHEDNTHFNEMGARRIAGLVATRLAELNIPLSKRVKAKRPGLTRDTPLGGPSCTEPYVAERAHGRIR
jgi:lysophospholipase L1-like esterase